jgi:membrane protease subunit HflC
LATSAFSALFQVAQTQQAIVTQLGEPIGDVLAPGLHVKLPFIQRAHFFDRRLLDMDADSMPVITADGQMLLISYYVKWRIDDPLVFFQRVQDDTGARQRLSDLIGADMLGAFGRHRLEDLLSGGRGQILADMTQRCQAAAGADGMVVVDIQIRHIGLDPQNQQAVFDAMRSEYGARSEKLRADARAQAMRQKAAADREQAEILAQAQRLAQQICGQADAQASRIYAAAYGQDPEFYDLTHSLAVSRKALSDKSVLLLTPDYEFLKYLKASQPSSHQARNNDPAGARLSQPAPVIDFQSKGFSR